MIAWLTTYVLEKCCEAGLVDRFGKVWSAAGLSKDIFSNIKMFL